MLDGVDLEVGAGQVMGLAGPNGSGKSTLLRAVAGIVRLDAGEVLVGGRFDPTLPAVRRTIGFVPQDVALYPRLTCEENLAFFGEMAGLRGGLLSARVAAALVFAELEDRRRMPVSQLSGGMKRRINLAVALLHEPDLLLLDEPTAGVDPETRTRLLADVRGFARRGHAVVIATHHADEAAVACDAIATLREGRVVSVRKVAAAEEPLDAMWTSLTGSAWGQA